MVEHAGKLDILINNAALFDAHNIVEITRESYDKLFSVNVAGTLFTMQAAAKQMIAQGHGGKIINMASQAGRRGESLVAVYCATKAAVISLTQSAGPEPDPAQDQRERHRPGRGRRRALGACRRHVRQAGRQEARPEEGRGRGGRPCRPLRDPDDLTGMAVFLASKEADYILAQTYNVDGGQWMS